MTPCRLPDDTYELPYGIWTCADGREVLFDRGYRPIAECWPSGEVRRADPDEFITQIVKQVWFQQTEPSLRDRRDPAVRQCLLAILDEWWAP